MVAWGSRYDQRQYHVASAASELLLHPMGLVYLEGYGRYRNYYRDALDRLGVTVNLIRVGTYKSFGEPFTENGPSAGLDRGREPAQQRALWSSYTEAVEQARKLAAGSVMRGIDALPQRLAASRRRRRPGWRCDARLVDALKTRDEMRQMLIERGEREDKAHKSFRQVSFDDYLQAPEAEARRRCGGRGGGRRRDRRRRGAGPGAIGGLSTAALIRKARETSRSRRWCCASIPRAAAPSAPS